MATANAVAVRARFSLAIRETLGADFVHFVQFVQGVGWESRMGWKIGQLAGDPGDLPNGPGLQRR